MYTDVIFYSVIVLGILGLAFGICLAVASQIFHVETDPKIEQTLDELPQLNCGACGYAGCLKYAEAVVKGGESVTLCAPGGSGTAEKIADIMGIELNMSLMKEVAFIFCCGGDKAKRLVDYQGIPNCHAAVTLSGGPMQCDYGCMMFHSCYYACKFGAIRITEEGLVQVIPEKCVACKACIKACPKNIIRMVPKESSVFVVCNSKDRGKDVMTACSRGCIGCTKCVKACPLQAISMVEGLAVIDHSKCKDCGKCIQVCPTKVIHKQKSPLTKESVCPQK